jgi:hypothetical protein
VHTHYQFHHQKNLVTSIWYSLAAITYEAGIIWYINASCRWKLSKSNYHITCLFNYVNNTIIVLWNKGKYWTWWVSFFSRTSTHIKDSLQRTSASTPVSYPVITRIWLQKYCITTYTPISWIIHHSFCIVLISSYNIYMKILNNHAYSWQLH